MSSLLPANWLELELDDIASLAPIQEVKHPLLSTKGVNLLIKREDQLHHKLGGNKLYKLHGHLRNALDKYPQLPIVSCGGAYSNHLYALAAAAESLAIDVHGLVRGERPVTLSPTLKDCAVMGMHLHFISRDNYRLITRNQPSNIERIVNNLNIGDHYWIPEGGGGLEGAKGLGALMGAIEKHIPVKEVFHACGTGASLAGLIAAASPEVMISGVSVLKAPLYHTTEIDALLRKLGSDSRQWRILEDYHAGGYAKFPPDLRQFVAEFETISKISLDPVYTAKMAWCIFDLVADNECADVVVAIHSGGLQGRRGMLEE